MLSVDWWSWKCARCPWTAESQRTVNNQQAVAEVLVRLHIQSHEQPQSADAVDPQVSNTGKLTPREKGI